MDIAADSLQIFRRGGGSKLPPWRYTNMRKHAEIRGKLHNVQENLMLETSLAGALYREFREIMRILTTFPGKNPQKPIIIRVFRPLVRIMIGFCGVFPRNVVRIHMNSRNSQNNSPGKEVSNYDNIHSLRCCVDCVSWRI